MPPTLLMLAALMALSDDDPTQGSRVTLDFRGATVPQVVQALGTRSGNALELQIGFHNRFNNNEEPGGRKVTLEARDPVPFWEAVDRLCREHNLRFDLTSRPGILARPVIQVVNAPSGDESLTQYVGPLRISQFRLHSSHEIRFGEISREAADEKPEPFRAEFLVQFEPRVLVASMDAPKSVIAEDDLGQSLAAPAPPDPARSKFPPGQAQSTSISVPLTLPKHPGRKLKRLSGVIPMEIATLPNKPALTIPLAGATGRTARVDGLIFDIQESHPIGSNAFKLRLTARAAPDEPRAIASRRRVSPSRLIEVVDAEGNPVGGNGSLSQGEVMTLDMTFFSPMPGNEPKEIRIHAPRFVPWDAPFQFADVPLP